MSFNRNSSSLTLESLSQMEKLSSSASVNVGV